MKKLSALFLSLASCGAPPAAAPPSRAEDLRRVAVEYESWGKVDDTLRWAPTRCDMPPPPGPRLSAAPSSTPHGRKLYHLYAKDGDAYTKKGVQPLGQVIVKEAWEPVSGKPGAKQGLYVMLKTSAEAADSDEGWVYATLLPDGKTVTSMGRVVSCMGCHRDAKSDRIFGLPGRVR